MGKYLILLSLLSGACGPDNLWIDTEQWGKGEGSFEEPQEHDSYFTKYLNSFIADCSRATSQPFVFPSRLYVNFKDLSSVNGMLGVCVQTTYYNGRVNKSIFIDSVMYPLLSETQREWLMYHELGHCYLNLEHDDTKLNIMSTFIPNDLTDINFEEMKDELCLKAN